MARQWCAKDNKVLVVDVAKLPAKFGASSLNRTDASSVIAVTLLGCWTRKALPRGGSASHANLH